MKDDRGISAMGAWIAIGIGIGSALGVALDNVAVGIATGAGICPVFGAVFDRTRSR